MKATVRPAARNTRCTCGNKFELIHQKLGYACTSCKTSRPKKFVVDFFWGKKRQQIYSDKHGQPLDSYSRAFNIAVNIQNEIDDKTFDPSKYVKTELSKFSVSTLANRYVEERLAEIAPSYQSHWKRNIRLIPEHFGAQDIREVRKADIKGFLDFLRSKFTTHKGKTTLNILNDFKAFMNFCRTDYEVIDIVPPFPEVECEVPDWCWLERDVQIKAFNLVEQLYPKDAPIFALLFLQGIRPGEARALKCKDADIRVMRFNIIATFSDNVLRNRRKGKKAKPSLVPIHTEIQPYIISRIENNLPEAFLYFNPRTGKPYTRKALDRIWDIVRTKLGLNKKVRLYDATRHSVATQLTSSGTSIYTTSKVLGHSTAKTTERYSHEHVDAMRVEIGKLSLVQKAEVVELQKSS